MTEITTLIAPPVPPDCDLRGLLYMPLEVARLLDSDLFITSTGDEFKACVALWCKSWTMVPASSLPDDERILAHYSGAGRQWKKVRARAMTGWAKATDGLLYHPVVSEKALAAWQSRLAMRERTEAARRARLAQKNAATKTVTESQDYTETESVTETVTQSVTEVVTESKYKVKCKGKGKCKGKREGEGEAESEDRPPPPPPAESSPREALDQAMAMVESQAAAVRAMPIPARPMGLEDFKALNGTLAIPSEDRTEAEALWRLYGPDAWGKAMGELAPAARAAHKRVFLSQIKTYFDGHYVLIAEDYRRAGYAVPANVTE